MLGQDELAANYTITPQLPGAAAQKVLGEEFTTEKHPLAKLARQGQQIITPLPQATPTNLIKELPLASMLSGGEMAAGVMHTMLRSPGFT